MRKHKHVCIFLQILCTIWMTFSVLPQPVSLMKFMLNLFQTICIQVREIFFGDAIKNTFDIVLL